MLSSEIPPGSSYPSNSPALRTDEEASEGLGERQTPSFSIRDYVFAARSKNITANWPFPRQFLQICLKQGVTDVLPPFEPPDLVRVHSFWKKVESDEPVACSGTEDISAQFESLDTGHVVPVDEELSDIKSKSCFQSDDLVLGCQNQALYSLSEKHKQTEDNGDVSDDETSEDNTEADVSVVTNNDQIGRIPDHILEAPSSLQASRSLTESSLELEAAELHPDPSELEKLPHPSEKKCRLIVKLSAITETRRAEDIAPTSSTVSDSMASKVCPVCKIFASTSNTTLNAHIDQCLSGDCNIKRAETETCNINRAETEIPKTKMKPTKKRLMVDIYATACRCTLEDLDRRNGTNWVSSGLNLIAPANEACSEIKKAKMSPVDIENDEIPTDGRDDENEGAVYVDSNGIKLRILSKFNDAPPLMSREQFKLKEHAKNIKEGKSMLLNKKRRFASKHSMYMKAKPQIKKLSTFKLFKGEIKAAQEENQNADTDQEKEDSPSEISTTPGQIKNSGSLSIRHWVCSKRSDLRKRLNHKGIHNLGKPVLRPRKTLPQSNQPDVGNSSVVKCNVLKFSRPPENLASSPKTKRVDFLLNTIQNMDNEKCAKPSTFSSKWSSESASRSGVMLKISRSVGEPVSSSRNRSEETNTLGQSDNSYNTLKPSRSSHSSMKATRSSTMKKDVLFGKQSFSVEGSSRDDSTDKPSTKLNFWKHRSTLGTGKRGQLPSAVNGGVLRQSIKHSGLDAARASTSRGTHCSQHLELISRSATEETTSQESLSSSNISESEEEESVRTIEKQKYNSLKWLHPDVECHDLDMGTSGMRVKCSGRAAMVSKPSSERCFSDLISDGTPIHTNGSPSSNAKLDPKSAVDENVHPFHRIEAHFEISADMLLYDEQEHNQDANESGFRTEADACSTQYIEFHAETSAQAPSACLTSHGHVEHEIPHDNSSVTSVKITSDKDLNLAIDAEPSGSPISTTSTISPSIKCSEFNQSKRESSMNSTLQGESGSAMPFLGSIENTERRNQELIRALPQLKKPDQFSGDQSCCCSRLTRESQLLRESFMAGMMLPSKGKQISNLCIAPGLSSDTIDNPSVESPSGVIISKALDPAAKAPTCADFSSPSPSPRTRTNSVLRLMGKNLMVTNNEESEQSPLVYQPAPDNLITERLPPNILGITGLETFPYYQLSDRVASFGLDPSVDNQQLTLHSPRIQVGGFAGYLHAGPKTKSEQQIYYNSPPVCYTDRMAALHQCSQRHISSLQANMANDVIVIDDSPEFESDRVVSSVNVSPAIQGSNLMQQRPISCFESQSQFLSSGVSSCFRPYSGACPRYYANNTMGGRTLEGSDPLAPRPVVFQSPTSHLRPTLYYSQTLR